MTSCLCCCGIEAKMEESNSEILCITNHEGFNLCALMFGYYRQPTLVTEVAIETLKEEKSFRVSLITNIHYMKCIFIVCRCYRYMAYYQLTSWCWVRVVLPSCVVKKIFHLTLGGFATNFMYFIIHNNKQSLLNFYDNLNRRHYRPCVLTT